MAGGSSDISSLVRGLGAARERARAAAIAAVDAFGEHVSGDAQERCPVDTGFLAASAATEPAQVSGDDVTKRIGFNASYAAVVHETWKQGPYSRNGNPKAQAKFLENAIRENAPKLSAFVAARVQAALGEGGGGAGAAGAGGGGGRPRGGGGGPGRDPNTGRFLKR